MPELQENQAACLVHGVGDEAPALDLFAAVNAGRPGVALSLLRHLGCFGHDESRRGPLHVVAGIESRWHVSGLAGARAGQRRHHHAVGKVVAPQPDRLEQRIHGRFLRSGGRRDEYGRLWTWGVPPVGMSGSKSSSDKSSFCLSPDIRRQPAWITKLTRKKRRYSFPLRIAQN